MALTSHTAPLTAAQAERLRELLEERGYEFEKKEHTLYAAKKGKLNVSVYAKGPKVLIQGKETEDFIRFLLEPEILGEARRSDSTPSPGSTTRCSCSRREPST